MVIVPQKMVKKFHLFALKQYLATFGIDASKLILKYMCSRNRSKQY